MESEKQHLRVQNFDDILPERKKIKKHGHLLPDTVRGMICAPSNGGKTNVLFSLLTNPNGLRFENIYLYSKSLSQPKYIFLEELLRNIEEIEYFPFSENSEVVSPEDVKKNSIIIFDDFVCEKQDNVRNFYCRGRHRDCDIFYLTQTYTRVGKILIRDNVNYLILFRQDELNLKHIYNDHVNCDMSYDKFKQLCSACWNSDKYGFVVISKDDELNNGRYRKGFDCFIDVS